MLLEYVSARSATVTLSTHEVDGFPPLYRTKTPYRLILNGQELGWHNTAVYTIYDLQPDTAYELRYEMADTADTLTFRTQNEAYTLDVRRFGAAGDGLHDDTAAIQAAIMCCPAAEAGGSLSRVLIPAGDYLVAPLFLKSHIRLEIAVGATLRLRTERERLPILPSELSTTAKGGESSFPLGSWEGENQDIYAALLNGIGVKDVLVYGQGVLDGQAQLSDWWLQPKIKRGAWRGRLLYLSKCCDVTVQGISFRNSPSWHIHPRFCKRVDFYSIAVQAPANSPNTDGLNPESCENTRILGAKFSVGDDCIAIKSGKPSLRNNRPCTGVEIAHCLMENGHGGVTIGSEMSGGVNDVLVHDCVMRDTDRGLRIKTRRGRGKDGIIDDIRFQHVVMERVSAPITVNALYFCDKDGHSPYVQSRLPLPVDERTPEIGRLSFENITATHCGTCAGYFLGLPEKKISELRFINTGFSYAADGTDAPVIMPVMADNVSPCEKRGLIIQNVASVLFQDVEVTNQQGEWLEIHGVDEVTVEEETR